MNETLKKIEEMVENELPARCNANYMKDGCVYKMKKIINYTKEAIQSSQKEPINHDNIIKIAEHYGLDRQLDKLQEESAELIQAIQKYIHCDSGLATVNLYSELADLSIVLEEVIHLLGCSEEVAKIREYKIERQLKRMAEGTE